MRIAYIKFIIIITLLMAQNAFGAQVARIILMRGEVTEVAPNGDSRALKKGEWVEEGSKVVTKPKSFAKLLFKDKSSINVGPNSNMAITSYPKGEAGVISLIKGQIRAKVEKDLLKQGSQEEKSKMFIRTKSAAMGVRGTDFIVGFNPVVNITKLDVITGIVAMVNTPDIDINAPPTALDNALNGPSAIKVVKGMRTAVTDASTPPAPPQDIPKTELENFQQSEEAFAPSEEEAPTEEVKKEEAPKEEKVEKAPKPKFNDPIPPDVPEEMFSSESPEVEETTVETGDIERLPTSEPEVSDAEEPEIADDSGDLVDASEIDEIVEDTTGDIEDEVDEAAEEVTEQVQNPNNFTTVNIELTTSGSSPGQN